MHPLAARADSGADRALLMLVLNTMTHGVWVVDPTGRTVLANERMAILLAVSPERLAAGGVSDLMNPEAAQVVREHLTRRSVGVRQEYEMDVVRLDGVQCRLHVAASPRYDRDGSFIGSVAICSDVTEQAELDSSLDRSRPPAMVSFASSEVSVSDRIQQHLVSHLSRDRRAGVIRAMHSRDLSRREISVVEMLVAGDRVPAIARRLYISQSTVRNHLSAVFHKLEVNGQQELISLLREAPPSADLPS